MRRFVPVGGLWGEKFVLVGRATGAQSRIFLIGPSPAARGRASASHGSERQEDLRGLLEVELV